MKTKKSQVKTPETEAVHPSGFFLSYKPPNKFHESALCDVKGYSNVPVATHPFGATLILITFQASFRRNPKNIIQWVACQQRAKHTTVICLKGRLDESLCLAALLKGPGTQTKDLLNGL